MKIRTAAKRGLTLIELVVVMALLAVLAAMLLPKFDGMINAANEAAAASSSVDAAKLISQYKTVKQVYPDKWDSLMDTTGTSLWTGGSVPLTTKGLNAELVSVGGANASSDKLTTGTLSTAQIAGLNSAGIYRAIGLRSDAASVSATTRPGDMYTVVTTLSASTPVAILNSGSSGGKALIDHIYRVNLSSIGTSGTVNPDPNTGVTVTPASLVVFGIGPQNALIPNSMLEAPTYGNANAQYIYNRLLAVFEVTNPTSGNGRVTLRAVLGADGDALDAMSTRLQDGVSL